MANYYTASSPSLIAPGGYFVFYDEQGALSFESSTRWDLPKTAEDSGVVAEQSCAYELSIPLSLALNATSVSGVYGENGYRKVLGKILKKYPGIEGIYDVKIDTHTITVLSFFTRKCLLVTARGFKIPGGEAK